MKIALHLVLILSLIPLPLSAQERKLMNTDIIALHQAGFSAELIVTKIKNSKSEFNTSVEALAVLKRSGLPVVMFVPDSVVYPQCARDGVSIYDLPTSRTENQLEAWQPLVDWLKGQLARVRELGAADLPVESAVQPGVVQIA